MLVEWEIKRVLEKKKCFLIGRKTGGEVSLDGCTRLGGGLRVWCRSLKRE